MSNLFAQGHSLLSSAHQILDLFQVVLSAVVLMLFENLDVCAAVVRPDMLDEVSAITDRFSFKRVNERTVTLIESVRSAHLQSHTKVE